MKIDIHAEVTAKIVAAIEAGTTPWVKPWKKGDNTGIPDSFFPLRHNLTPYRGMNVILLWMEERKHPVWMTYKQATELGAQVRKGEKAAHVYYASKFTPKNDPDGKEFFMMKSYAVFNCEQIDGLPAQFGIVPPSERPKFADPHFDHLGADVRHGGDKAFYSPSSDHIQLPHPKQFKSPEDYFATKAHEFIHWTGSEKRLHREFGKRFGDNNYAFEELVAEIGSAMMCCLHGLAMEPRPDHAQYISRWLEVLKGDKKAIFSAATFAQKACDLLMAPAQVPQETPEETSLELETA